MSHLEVREGRGGSPPDIRLPHVKLTGDDLDLQIFGVAVLSQPYLQALLDEAGAFVDLAPLMEELGRARVYILQIIAEVGQISESVREDALMQRLEGPEADLHREWFVEIDSAVVGETQFTSHSNQLSLQPPLALASPEGAEHKTPIPASVVPTEAHLRYDALIVHLTVLSNFVNRAFAQAYHEIKRLRIQMA